MKNRINEPLLKLYSNLEKEIRQINKLKNSLILKKKYETSSEIYRIENTLHETQDMICRLLEEQSQKSNKKKIREKARYILSK
jgi:hypothetical protein